MVSSGGQPTLSRQSTSLNRKVGAALPSQNNTSSRELNLILFGLQETSSIVETKKYVDEILAFIAGRPVSIKDLFRLGKLAKPSSPSASISQRPRPVLIKLVTAWDRRVVLFSKRKLKEFRLQHLFLREDLSPDHKVRQWRSEPKPTHATHSASTSSGASNSKASSDSASIPMSRPMSPSHSSSSVVHLSSTDKSNSLPPSLLPSASASHSPSNSISLTVRETSFADHGT